MFTGIIETIGTIAGIDRQEDDQTMIIEVAGLDLADMAIGASLAVQGVCLSVISKQAGMVTVDVSAETLRCTTLAHLRPGNPVNLEQALRFGDRLDGHLVSGHVDGIGVVTGREILGESLVLRIQAPRDLSRYLCRKGSISVDGVSLTTNTVAGAEFDVNLIPHTRAVTTLGALERGSEVNLEVDMLARYLERQLEGRLPDR